MTSTQQSQWHNEVNTSAWDSIKEAVRRDWEQTKFDLGLPGGHELNQNVVDTLKQATQTASIPPDDRPNPPKVIGAWDEAEYPIGYGYSARRDLSSEHPTWNEGIEQRLQADWEAHHGDNKRRWGEVRSLVRYGYEYGPRK
jgi:hypothetical protein